MIVDTEHGKVEITVRVETLDFPNFDVGGPHESIMGVMHLEGCFVSKVDRDRMTYRDNFRFDGPNLTMWARTFPGGRFRNNGVFMCPTELIP